MQTGPNINTGRANVNSVKSNVNSVRHNVNSIRTNVKQPVPTSNSNSFSPVRPQGNWGTAVKTSSGYNWRRTRPNSNYNSGSNFVRTVNAKGPQGRPEPEKAWTVTASTLADGTLELRATIDTLEYTITEASIRRVLEGVPRPLLPAMLPIVVVDQSAGQADQAVDQPSPYEPLPSLSHPPVLFATTESEPTLVAEQITYPTSLTPEPDSEPIKHTFEQPSPEHQPLSPRQETEVPQSQDSTHPHMAEERTMIVDDLLQLVPKLISKVDSLETELKQTKLTMGKALVKLVKK
ncbi:hypothetical protein Tco_1469520, partial [Tanacetum coccineum]